MASKPKTAVDGNAPGGPDFEDGPKASGKDAVLGKQVRPETQTSEADGHRTLVNPVTDPGPVLPEGEEYKHPDTSQGETFASANKMHDIVQRHSTAPDWAGKGLDGGSNTMTTQMLPEVRGQHGASDVYNKEKGEGLTDMAKKKSAEGRELAKTSGNITEGEADKAPAPENEAVA